MVWFKTWSDERDLEWLIERMDHPDFDRRLRVGSFWAESLSGDQLALVADGDDGRHESSDWPPGRFRVFRHSFATGTVQEETYLIQSTHLEGVFDIEKPVGPQRYEPLMVECTKILNRLLEVPRDLAAPPDTDEVVLVGPD